MAFQQPQQRPQAPRPYLSVTDPPRPASPARKRSIEESQEWILFSPAQNADSVSLSRTSQTPRTATHLSDFGSLETRARSNALGEEEEYLANHDLETDDECAELDSLDDGLHAFHEPFSSSVEHLDHSGGTVLPTHDGFGTFPTSSGIQEQLWQFERFNPQRRSRLVRRRSSHQQRAHPLDEEHDISGQDDRMARIEEWRMEQSKAVLEEIERETRRQRRRLGRMNGSNAASDARSVTQGSIISAALQSQSSGSTDTSTGTHTDASENESFWRRITRRVIRDLMGLDEDMLSVIFGERVIDDPSPTPTRQSPIATAVVSESRVKFNDPDPGWQVRLLERIARELGTLVNHLSDHDGAFHAYKRAQVTPDYAGLPINLPRPQSLRQRRRLEEQRRQSNSNATTEGLFTPTVTHPNLTAVEAMPDTSLWGIDEEPDAEAAHSPEDDESKRERDYWERDVDVKMIFNYLKSRFYSAVSDPTPSPPPVTTSTHPDLSGSLLPASWATAPTTRSSTLGTSPESQRRAEIIRRQHPLVSRAVAASAAASQSRRRESLLLRRHHQHLQSIVQKRGPGPGGSSCASRSRHSRSGSSRHYWDLGGSVGSVGSGPARSSGLGGWGEV